MAIMVRTMRQPVKLLSQKDEASMARYFGEHEHKTSAYSGWVEFTKNQIKARYL